MITTIPAPAPTKIEPEGVAARPAFDFARFATTLADLEVYADGFLEGLPPDTEPSIDNPFG